MKKYFIIYPALAAMLFFASCGEKDGSAGEEGQEAEHEHGEEHHENEKTVSLTQEQFKTIKLELGGIEQKQLTASLKANGVLKVPNQNKATITSLYGGVVRSILVQPGNVVRKGQTVAIIANPEFITLQEEYLSLQSKVQYAQIEYDRQKELSSKNAGSLKTFQQAETELKTLRTRQAAVKKQLELIGINTARLSNENIASVVSVTSPVGGAVSTVLVNIGANVDITTPIAEVVDNSQLHLDLYIYEKDLPKVKVGQTIHFTLTNNPGKEYDAEVFGVSNTFESETRALAVHASVKGDKTGLIDGMSITALVSIENATVTAIPTEAIVNYLGTDYVFIQTDAHSEAEHHDEKDGENHDEHGNAQEETTFERIAVRKGTTDVGYSEVTFLEAVPADAKIVVKGAFFLLAKMTNAGEAHEH